MKLINWSLAFNQRSCPLGSTLNGGIDDTSPSISSSYVPSFASPPPRTSSPACHRVTSTLTSLVRLLLVSIVITALLVCPVVASTSSPSSPSSVGVDTSPANSSGSGSSPSPSSKPKEDMTGKAFLASLSVIVVSELGDKTFFIAAIMAMTHSRLTVFAAAISALIVMTLLSVGMGLSTSFIPVEITHYISAALFLIFGGKMLYDAGSMSGDEAKEEYEEVQKELSKKDPTGSIGSMNGSAMETVTLSSSMEQDDPDDTLFDRDRVLIPIDRMDKDPESGVIRSVTTSTVSFRSRLKRKLIPIFSLVFLETFTMTFVAEWGDRSQLATIILAAREDALSVSLGAIIGHSFCSALAVVAGRMIAHRISVKSVTIIGGIVFLAFGLFALAMGVDKPEGEPQ